MAEGAEESEVGEKPWSDHKLYTDEFTTHFAVLLSQLCERSLVTRVKLCGPSRALDCQSVLKEIWKSNVSKLYYKDKNGAIVLHSDKKIHEVLRAIEEDVCLFESLADKSSQKLPKPQQRERDKSPLPAVMDEDKEEFPSEKPEAGRAPKRALSEQNAGASSSESSKSSSGSSIPQKIRLPEAPGMYYSHARTRQAIAFLDIELSSNVRLKMYGNLVWFLYVECCIARRQGVMKTRFI